MSEKKNKRKSIRYLKIFQDLIINNDEDEEKSSEDLLQKSAIIKKKEMISYKKLTNIDLTTYDYIFMVRQICNKTLQDFSSFKELVVDIKKKFKPELLEYKDIKTIQSEGKFCFNKYNITKLLPLNRQKIKTYNISLNSKYIRNLDSKSIYPYLYLTKSFFKGKHCFEVEIMSLNNYEMIFGLININYLDTFRKEIDKSGMIRKSSLGLLSYLNSFILKSPICIKKNNNMYHHFISYGDAIGLGFDLDKKLFYLYLNGEIINTLVIDMESGKNISFVPIIILDKFTEIIFNSGENLKFGDVYKKLGFIPLDEEGKNNYENSQLINVTNEYINILINNGKSIINNKNISYSDINQIYHEIFDFLGNTSFQHSYIIKNCFIKNIELKSALNDEDLFFYYICIKYILNSVKEQKQLLKRIIFNLVESIHICLITGNSSFKKLFKLLTYLFSQKDIINIIAKFSKKTMRDIFSQIFIPFSTYGDFFQKVNLDFIIPLSEIHNNNKNKEKNKNDDANIVFKDLSTGSLEFSKYLFLTQNLYNKEGIINIFSELVEIILKSGIESENNKDINDNILMQYFRDFLSVNKVEIFRNYEGTELNNLFKSFFIPGMMLFNDEKNKIENKNLISYALTKYFKENNYEKIGGTMKYIKENYIKEIQNFEEISKMKINSVNNVFLLEFLEFCFYNEGSNNFWNKLDKFVSRIEEFTEKKFIYSVKNDSFISIRQKLIKYIEYILSLPNLYDLEILANFLRNFIDFINNELYPKKLIYFFPENIIHRFINIIQLLKTILKRIINFQINPKLVAIFDENYLTEIKNKKNNIKILCKENLKKYLSILVKIISDKNIKKLIFKCQILEEVQNSITEVEYFTNEELFNIFNFLNEIHDDSEYKKYASDFMKIFNNKVIKLEGLTDLGKKLKELFKEKDNNNILRTILTLLYSDMNSSLTKLEEIFGEYKFKPKTNGNNNINQNNINDGNNNDNNNNNLGIIIDNLGVRLVGAGFRMFNPFLPGIRGFLVNVNNLNERRNLQQLSDKEKLDLLNESLKDTYFKFGKLINFYLLASDINELYNFKTFENKYLNNLLVSLYNIVFSSTNSNKLNDTKVIDSYKKLKEVILHFYAIIFYNISQLNDKDILKEIAKRRNIYHLKELSESFNKLKEIKKEEINKDRNNQAEFFNDFLASLEKIVPEEQTTKLINIKNSNNENSESKPDDKNICPICADGIIDTHIIPCDHSICRNCLFQCLSDKKGCPFCRVEIQGIKEDKNFKI